MIRNKRPKEFFDSPGRLLFKKSVLSFKISGFKLTAVWFNRLRILT